MIYGIGTDLIEVARVAEKLKHKDFKARVFSQKEIEYCDAQGRPTESYAARFAAKEAFFKALGTGWEGHFPLCDIEILNDKLGKPELYLINQAKVYFDKKSFGKIHVSLSHLKEMASAFVVIERVMSDE